MMKMMKQNQNVPQSQPQLLRHSMLLTLAVMDLFTMGVITPPSHPPHPQRQCFHHTGADQRFTYTRTFQLQLTPPLPTGGSISVTIIKIILIVTIIKSFVWRCYIWCRVETKDNVINYFCCSNLPKTSQTLKLNYKVFLWKYPWYYYDALISRNEKWNQFQPV